MPSCHAAASTFAGREISTAWPRRSHKFRPPTWPTTRSVLAWQLHEPLAADEEHPRRAHEQAAPQHAEAIDLLPEFQEPLLVEDVQEGQRRIPNLHLPEFFDAASQKLQLCMSELSAEQLRRVAFLRGTAGAGIRLCGMEWTLPVEGL